MQKDTYTLIKKKKRKSLDVFYERYGKKLLGYANKNWQVDEDTAWDLIYKTFYSIIDNIDKYTFESEQKFSSFVLRTFLNNLRNYYRDKKKELNLSSKENLESFSNTNSEEESQDTEQMKLLKTELSKLEDWQRMLLLLRAQRMPYSEIAKYIDKPQEQLKVYYSRLKQRISKQLHQEMEVNNG
jgi:RNA polymerase sigma factor (sigma-70 family)